MNPKMILTDLDGTLICSDGSISECIKLILKSCQNRGIYVVIATAAVGAKNGQYSKSIKGNSKR